MWICPICETKNTDQNKVCRCCQHQRPQKQGKAKLYILGVVAVAVALFVGFLLGQAKVGQQESNSGQSPVMASQAPATAQPPVVTAAPTPEPTPVPTSEPTPEPTPEPDPVMALINEQFPFLGESPSFSDLDYLEEETGTRITRPSKGQLLDSYELRYVHSEGGHSIYYFYKPKADSAYKFKRNIGEDTPLIVLARKNTMICVTFMFDGTVKYGWVSELLTTDVAPSDN